MNLIEKSLEIALRAYAGKKDKAGNTYILHPLRIMSRLETEDEMSMALLHDVIEDSEITKEDLINEDIPENIAEAVAALTKLSNETYDAFIRRIINNKLAAKVKKYDIEDNINVLRLDSVSEKDLERIAKYHKAWKTLDENS